MKALTNKDLPVLAEIIGETIYRRDVYVEASYIYIKGNDRLFATVVIRGGKAFSDCLIEGIPMKHRPRASSHDWQILI